MVLGRPTDLDEHLEDELGDEDEITEEVPFIDPAIRRETLVSMLETVEKQHNAAIDAGALNEAWLLTNEIEGLVWAIESIDGLNYSGADAA